MNTLAKINAATANEKFNPHFFITGSLELGGRNRDVTFRVTREGSIMAVAPDAKSTSAVGRDANEAFQRLINYNN